MQSRKIDVVLNRYPFVSVQYLTIGFTISSFFLSLAIYEAYTVQQTRVDSCSKNRYKWPFPTRVHVKRKVSN